MHVEFDYQVDPAGNPRPVVSRAITGLVEYRQGGLDFAVFRVDGQPGQTFGRNIVSATDPAVGEMMTIIQHPNGLRKVVEAGALTSLARSDNANYLTYDTIDTLGGSSGAGVLGVEGLIKGIHTNAGCDPNVPQGPGANSGLRIEAVLAQSPTLTDLAYQPFPAGAINLPHWVRTLMAGGEELYTLTGTAIVHLRGTGAAFRRTGVHLTVPIAGLPAGRRLQIKHWAPCASLAAIGNANEAINEGYAVDGFSLHFPVGQAVDTVGLLCRVAIRDTDGDLYRIDYRIQLLGTLV
jgi:hypothetical protein